MVMWWSNPALEPLDIVAVEGDFDFSNELTTIQKVSVRSEIEIIFANHSQLNQGKLYCTGTFRSFDIWLKLF